MEKKLVKFSLADDVKSEAPAGYVESLEKLVNDIVIPRELEKMCTQEGRVYNYSFADYQKMARDIWGGSVSVVIKNAPHRVLCGDVGSANHHSPGYHTYWRLIADDGTDCYQVQEQHCAAEHVDEELKRFADQNNGRLQWLVKNMVVKQPGYQELCKKIGANTYVGQKPQSHPVTLGRDDEIKSIYNVRHGATIHPTAWSVVYSLKDSAWNDRMRQKADEVADNLRALAPLLCDGSIIAGDISKNNIFVVHPNVRCGEDVVGTSYYKHNIDTVLSSKNWFNKYSVHELAKSINDQIEFGRRAGSASLDYHRYVSRSDNVVASKPEEPCVRVCLQQNRNETLKWVGITCLSFGGLLMSISAMKWCAQELVAEREKSHKKEIVIDRPDSVHNQRGDIEWHNVSNARNGHSR